jgi:hypothetical protein
MTKLTFILNDESVINSYGFQILSSGGKLQRFLDNPVMLSNHLNTNENVIGKWENVKLQDGKIMADSNFDQGSELAIEIAGKVDRGYLKGASMGIIPNWDSMIDMGGQLMLTEWELAEASIVPVPSNRNSIAIYSADGKLLKQEDVKSLCLSIQEKIYKPNNSKKNMKKILLSVPALVVLGLSSQPEEGVDASIVESKLLSLATDLKSLKSENDSLKAEAKLEKEQRETVKKAAVTQAVELAISAGKITADKKDEFIELGMINEALLNSTLITLTGKTSFSAGVKVPQANGSEIVSSVDDFQKLSLEKQLSFKNDHPDAYKKLFS